MFKIIDLLSLKGSNTSSFLITNHNDMLYRQLTKRLVNITHNILGLSL